MKIVDCFIFHDELEMLEFRLTELADAADWHVLVEAPKTIAGDDKELYYEKHRQRYEAYAAKLIHIVAADMPHVDMGRRGTREYQQEVWQAEFHQRRSIDRGIEALELDEDDLIIIADCDEIPDPETLQQCRNRDLGSDAFSLEQDFYRFNLTCKHQQTWCFVKILNFKTYKRMGRDCETIRRISPQVPQIRHGGWHFTDFGGVDQIISKLQSFSHQEFNQPKYRDREYIKQRIKRREDPFGRPNETYTELAVEDNPYLPRHYKMLPSVSS